MLSIPGPLAGRSCFAGASAGICHLVCKICRPLKCKYLLKYDVNSVDVDLALTRGGGGTNAILCRSRSYDLLLWTHCRAAASRSTGDAPVLCFFRPTRRKVHLGKPLR